ncbi:hypothetical protein GCM10020218_055830 [Dactylosporangium vinaceum]
MHRVAVGEVVTQRPLPDREVAVKWLMPVPAVAGSDHFTTRPLCRAVTLTFCGTLGAALGYTAVLGALGSESPSEPCATTVKVYASPSVSPVTVHVVAPVVEQVSPPGVEVTV